ncbi:MAG: FAD-dependent oxidoreductase [Saprospiraceae bacterium]|nr:FAD-dependent oxidoreductase [Saprospiraceae bacterium]
MPNTDTTSSHTRVPSVLLLLFFFVITLLEACQPNTAKPDYDLIIYGGTSAGIAAAIQATRMNKTVLLVAPENRIGGLTTGGLGQTDIGNKVAIGGISREFYEKVKDYYDQVDHWKWQNRSDYKDGGQTRTGLEENTMWTFEPSAAMTIYENWIQELQIKVVTNEKLDRQAGVKKENGAITTITTLSGKTYSAQVFIDATYEGDLMATAGVSYRLGRESNSDYAETLNGVHAKLTDTTMSGKPSHDAINHNFVDGVDPYVVSGDISSGLLPYINPKGPGLEGQGDKNLQAYCFRMCLTDHPQNRIPFEKPENYQEINYELLLRNYEAGENGFPWINSDMPNRKTDTNNRTGFSTDFIGQNYNYPEASYEERESTKDAHRDYQKGLMWTLANHSRIPDKIRNEVARWGMCKDEFEREDGWQEQLYIREARRLNGMMTMTQYHCESIEVVPDPIGMGAYGMDSHHTQRYVNDKGHVKNEGNVEAHVASPYPISYRSILPKKEDCTNLLVPVCLSATHIAFGSIRMEPVFMVLGQSAATAACLAIDQKKTLHELKYDQLKSRLLADKQVLGL